MTSELRSSPRSKVIGPDALRTDRMDADNLREKLQNLETLMNRLLDKEVHLQNSQKTSGYPFSQTLIKDVGGYRERKNSDRSSSTTTTTTTTCPGDGNCASDCDRTGQNCSSSSSSSSWEATMFSLAKELETICSRGSSPRDSPTLSPCLTPTNVAPVPSRRVFSFAHGGSPIPRGVPHQGSFSEGNSDPLPTPPPQSGARPVRVRHEETEDRLDRSLTMICRHNSPDQSPRPGQDGPCLDGNNGEEGVATAARNATLKYRDSVKHGGLRFRLDLEGKDPDQTTASMDTEDHILRVYSGGEMIHLLQLAENTDPQTLHCSVVDGATLFIKQKAKETMCLENEGGSSEVHLPIVRHDESTLTATITLRLPPCYHRNDDVVVKTIDDTLMIRAGVNSDGGTQDLVDHRRSAPGGSGGDPRFCVAMNLPEGTDSRTVCAWVTKGQLTVKGQLVPTSRRMTCAF